VRRVWAIALLLLEKISAKVNMPLLPRPQLTFVLRFFRMLKPRHGLKYGGSFSADLHFCPSAAAVAPTLLQAHPPK
jgi:hypothetical protein